MSDDPADRGLSAAQIAKQVDASLERLRTDYVYLYQCHRFDPDEAMGDVMVTGPVLAPFARGGVTHR